MSQPLSPLKVFFSYLNCHKKWLITCLLSTVIYLLIPWLSRVDLEPVIYATILFWTIAFIGFAIDFTKYYHNHLSLNKIMLAREQMNQFVPIVPSDFPPTDNLIENDYQNLVELLQTYHQQLIEKQELQNAFSKRYYTLWAHQIKTPISAARLLTQENRNPFPCEELQQELFKVEQYVDMVLQYLRLGTGTNDLLLQKYSLAQIVRQAVKRTATLFIYKKIQLELEDIDCQVITDEKWMVFVLEQLLTNAVKYTKSGKVSIRLSTTLPDTLLIEDTGIGIRQEDLPKIFDWGYTGQNGRIEQRSTGIGLFLCRQVMGLLGHQIKIQSQLGVGTMVILSLGREALEIE